MVWIILSGALHNFNMYALSVFQMPFLQRYHGATLTGAGRLLTLLTLAGIPGLLLGGFAGDIARRTRSNGRLLVAALAVLLSTPFMYLALNCAPGNLLGFGLFMALGGGLMFVYYSTVYSTIQDVIEPSLRGTAMALYFFAMYVLGGSFGPVLTGFLSELFTTRAATAAGRRVPQQRRARAIPRRRPSFGNVSSFPCSAACSRSCFSPPHSRSGKIWRTCSSGCRN